MKTRLLVALMFLMALACNALISAATATPIPPTATATLILPTETPVPPTDTPTATASPTPYPSAPTLKIVSDLPMSGSSSTQTKAIVNAERLRLEQANYQACGGRYKLAYETGDDASPFTGSWDPVLEKANAEKAVGDMSVIAYLGTFNSGAARVSIPILNQAGVVMISPANTYPGLTKPVPGSPNEPGVYYPTGIRNYARLVSSDDIQGGVDAKYMFQQLGVKTIYVLDDQELYGVILANAFEATARSLGMKVLGHGQFQSSTTDFTALMKKISASNTGKPPDGIFAGMVGSNAVPALMLAKVNLVGDNEKVKFIGGDGILTQAFIDSAGQDAAEGVYASVAGLPFPDALTPAGKKFLAEYETQYGKDAEPYSIYGYETMNVLLKAVENVCSSGGDPTSRQAVRNAVFAIKDFNGVLGTWSFDANGDTTLTETSIYQVKNGTYEFVGAYK